MKGVSFFFETHMRQHILSLQLKYITQIREQMSGPDLYVLTVAFLALKKTGFSEKKNSSQKK